MTAIIVPSVSRWVPSQRVQRVIIVLVGSASVSAAASGFDICVVITRSGGLALRFDINVMNDVLAHTLALDAPIVGSAELGKLVNR